VALALLIEVRDQPAGLAAPSALAALTLILVLALMRPFKSTLIALQCKHRRDDFGERV
jgi:uncharacterized protein (DUF983 family)